MSMENQHTSKQFLIKKNPQRMVENIPEELKTLEQWVVWKKEERGGKITKVPYNPSTPKRKAQSTDPSTWGTSQEPCQVDETGHLREGRYAATAEAGGRYSALGELHHQRK